MVKTILLSASMVIMLNAAQNITKKADAEVGWKFGDLPETNTTKQKNKSTKKILQEMLEVQKKQLETQNKILQILQDRFDPQPETIIGEDGQPCIANSSANCYKWIPEPEAKRYPVVKEFFSNPTIENAAKYMKWYSKHTKNAEKAGLEMYFAKNKYGENATNFNLKRSSMMDPNGETEENEKQTKIRIFKYHMNNRDFYFNIYIGRSLEADIFGLKGFENLKKQIPDLRYNVIFYNEDVKNKLQLISKKYKFLNEILFKDAPSAVSTKMFKDNGIYATPTLEIVTKNNDSQIMSVGKVSPSSLISKTIKYLKLKKVIKENALFIDYKVWDNSQYLEKNMYDNFGKIFKIDQYKYNNTMHPKTLEENNNND